MSPAADSTARRTPTLARLERILVMVPWLLEHPGVDVDEVCARFDVGRDELAGDLDVLGYCGLPGYGGGDLVEATVAGDRVTVRMADFFRRPLRLSLREALTLLLAGEALSAVEGLPESAALRSAVAKLRAAFDSGEAPPGLAIDLSAPGDEHLAPLRQATAAGAVVHLTYRSASKAETTSRDVEPWALVADGGAWYLQGWCRLAEAPRDFRLDRIRDLRLTGEIATADCGQGAGRPPRDYQAGPDDVEVVVELAPGDWWVAEEVVADRVVDRGGVSRRVTFRTATLGWVARLLLRLGGRATVVRPEELAGEVRDLARQALARYGR